MANTIKIKRGLKANLPSLEIGEQAYCTDTNELFIGTSGGNVLVNVEPVFDFGEFPPPPPPPPGPGPQEVIAGDYTAGFYGEISQTDFGITMTQVMSDLGITEGTDQNTSEPLLKFVHDGKVKFINKKTIRHSISWDHIASKINVYGGTTTTFGGNSYKVRLIRGWGQVSGSTNSLTTPDYENGPIYTVNWNGGEEGNSGVNFPTDTSDWNANNPNEWNTLMFPIHVDGQTQTQTGNVPNWASYSNSDLNIETGNGRATWTQETINTNTSARLARGYSGLADAINYASFVNFDPNFGLRLVFELITEGDN